MPSSRLDRMRSSPSSDWTIDDVSALCREHGVSEILSADVDLLRFPGLRVTNPFARAA